MPNVNLMHVHSLLHSAYLKTIAVSDNSLNKIEIVMEMVPTI